jgi:hypothetical protein
MTYTDKILDFLGVLTNFRIKLRHFENAYFAYFKHLEHILGKNAYQCIFLHFSTFLFL